MCTAVSFVANSHFFGRTLDYERSYGEGVAVTPRRYTFKWRHGETLHEQYAMVGMAVVQDGYPLYYDAINEKGLCAAGLLFAGNAVYLPAKHGYDNVASFELIPWLLARCETVTQVKECLKKVRITSTPFSADLLPTPLHWLIADKTASIVVEPLADGLHIYENPIGVLTNNPPFDYHLLHLTDFLHVSDTQPANNLYSSSPLQLYSRGMGGIGLPGDYSSGSRFVRAAFLKQHMAVGENKEKDFMQAFRILHGVEVPQGCVTLENGCKVYSLYTSCCDVDEGIYRYTGYFEPKIISVNMFLENLTGDRVVWYPFLTGNTP